MPVSEQGISRDRYMLIPRVLIFARRGEQVLLLKGSPTKRLWANRFNGLGGHVEPGETALAAARRELFEEAGLEAALHLCGTLLVDTGQNPGVGIYVFTGECAPGEAKESAEGTLHWLNLREVFTLPGVDDLPYLVERIQRMRPGDPPFAARSFYDADGKLQMEFDE